MMGIPLQVFYIPVLLLGLALLFAGLGYLGRYLRYDPETEKKFPDLFIPGRERGVYKKVALPLMLAGGCIFCAAAWGFDLQYYLYQSPEDKQRVETILSELDAALAQQEIALRTSTYEGDATERLDTIDRLIKELRYLTPEQKESILKKTNKLVENNQALQDLAKQQLEKDLRYIDEHYPEAK